MWPPKFSDCIEACNVARRRCERLVTAGLAQPDVNKVTQVIVVARDVARIATLTSQLLERGSKCGLRQLHGRAERGTADQAKSGKSFTVARRGASCLGCAAARTIRSRLTRPL